MSEHYQLGASGEQRAEAYLRKKGYSILARNYRFNRAEIDIIAKKESILVAVEVKTRGSDFFGNPQDFVTKKKIQLMVMAINQFITEQELDLEIRFDIIAILKKKEGFILEHIENAFYHF